MSDFVCNTSGDFSTALTGSVGGDTITLTAGTTFTGPFTLPVHSGSGYVTIRSSDLASLAEGVRVAPADVSHMPKIVTATDNTSAILTAVSAAHWKLLGLEITTSTGSVSINDLVSLGDGSSAQDQLSEVPDDIVIDRCYIHAATTSQSLKRGISLQSSNTTITNSYISDFKVVGQDSQAIAGWNGPGPFTITNNRLIAAGENIIFGGAAPSITNLIPSDITFNLNHCSKPLTWKTNDPSYAGIHWSVKNIFEIKNARRVQIWGNLFEYNWQDSQAGYAVLFTCIDDSSSWARIDDVVFANNIIRHSGSGINIRGRDDIGASMTNLTIKNNLLEDISTTWNSGGSAAGTWLQILRGPTNPTINHNTAFADGTTAVGFDGETGTGLVITNNIFFHNTYGVKGTGGGVGTSTLNLFYPSSYTFSKNVLQGGSSGDYPANNFFPANVSDIQFVNYAGGDYHLGSGSPYKNAALDGTDIGANIDNLLTLNDPNVTGNVTTSNVRLFIQVI